MVCCRMNTIKLQNSNEDCLSGQQFDYTTSPVMKPTITIVYCPKCGWLLRAAYMAQEFLTTFADDIHSVTLQPGEINGSFYISVDEQVVFDRKTHGGFPEIATLKQWVRDVVNPGKPLGHTDRKKDVSH